MSALALISVPFNLGQRAEATGAGPLELLGRMDLVHRLRNAGHEVEVAEVGEPAASHEVGRVFEIAREVAPRVAAARRGGRTPITLAGDCNVCLGVLGGLAPLRTGIVWLDAHGDFHTPDSTESGFFDGMAVATATGDCWHHLAESVPGFRPVRGQDVVLVGVRDVEPGERERLERSDLTVIAGGRGPGDLPLDQVERALSVVASRVEGIYLHVDFDAIDPTFGRANGLAVPGGLHRDEVRTVAAMVSDRCPVVAASFTAYDPCCDSRFGQTALGTILATAQVI